MEMKSIYFTIRGKAISMSFHWTSARWNIITRVFIVEIKPWWILNMLSCAGFTFTKIFRYFFLKTRKDFYIEKTTLSLLFHYYPHKSNLISRYVSIEWQWHNIEIIGWRKIPSNFPSNTFRMYRSDVKLFDWIMQLYSCVWDTKEEKEGTIDTCTYIALTW